MCGVLRVRGGRLCEEEGLVVQSDGLVGEEGGATWRWYHFKVQVG